MMIKANEVKVNEKTNERVNEFLSSHQFYLRCKLGDILKERGLTMQELCDLTGIRVAAISEMINMKRSTLSMPHLLVIAQTLRITDISEMFEFIMSESTREKFEEDQKVIKQQTLLPEQEEYLSWLRYENKLIKEFKKIIKKKKPTVQ